MSNNFTEVKIYPRTNSKFKALRGNGSCVVGGLVRVNFTILEGEKGLFATLPERAYTDAEGNLKRVKEVGIPDKEVYAEFQKTVREAYVATMDSPAPQPNPGDDPANDDIPF
jgi:DNA-binding cell septation regulator SpoVG